VLLAIGEVLILQKKKAPIIPKMVRRNNPPNKMGQKIPRFIIIKLKKTRAG